jgi:hypothetical protein
MQCAKCGFENPAEAKFCGRCGETMKLAAPPSPVGGEEVSQGLKTGIVVGSIFIPLLGIIMGAIYMNDPNPEKKKVGRLWLYVGIGVFAFECVCFAVFGIIGSMNPNAYK